MQYNFVVCGGTFDYIHKGHKAFLRFVFSFGKHAVIGLTSDTYIASRKTSIGLTQYESYAIRKKSLEAFLESEGLLDKTTILSIDDFYGPTLSKKFALEAIIVSNENKEKGEEINQERIRYRLTPLKILVFPIETGDDEKVISSSRIRNGEIDRDGIPYIKSEWLSYTLYLPLSLREQLQKPYGELLPMNPTKEDILQRSNSATIVSVGDITTQVCNSLHINQKISVIDSRVQRLKKFYNISEIGFTDNCTIIKAQNAPGSLEPSLFNGIQEAFDLLQTSQQVVINVEGEEDLAVMPIILSAPLGFAVLYGQPDQGMMRVQITEVTKKKVYDIVSSFTFRKAITRGY